MRSSAQRSFGHGGIARFSERGNPAASDLDLWNDEARLCDGGSSEGASIKTEDLERLAEALGGMSILGCLPGSPGDLAGLRYGDVLLEVNGKLTPDLGAYLEAIRERRTLMSIRVFRNGIELRLDLQLPERPPSMAAHEVLDGVLSTGAMPRASASSNDDDLPC